MTLFFALIRKLMIVTIFLSFIENSHSEEKPSHDELIKQIADKHGTTPERIRDLLPESVKKDRAQLTDLLKNDPKAVSSGKQKSIETVTFLERLRTRAADLEVDRFIDSVKEVLSQLDGEQGMKYTKPLLMIDMNGNRAFPYGKDVDKNVIQSRNIAYSRKIA